MANPLDVFSIVFNSDGLKEFEQELKSNENELDKTEKKVKTLEDNLKDLNLQQAENTVKINETKEALTKARAELEKLNNAANEQKVKTLEKELAKLDNTALKNATSIKKISAELDSAKNSVETFKKSVSSMKGSTQAKLLELKNNFAKLTKAVGALAFVGTTIKKSLDFYEQGEQLEFLAEKTGVAVEKLQLLGNAAKKYGGSTEGIAGTIENLRSQYQDARMGNVSGGMKNAYMKYGFQISSDPEQTLQRLAKKMETMKSDTAKWDLAKNLGIDEGTTRLLIQGQAKYNEELKKASKYKLYTKEDIQRMRDYRQISGDIRMGIESIFGSIYRSLLPAITAIAKVVRNVTDWLSEHEGAVKIAWLFIAIAAAVTLATGAVLGLNTAFTFLTKNPVVLAIMAVIAAIVLLVTVIQDFIVFLQGGDSIIGDILEKMGVDTDKLRQNCLNFFNSIKNGIKSAIDWLKSLGGMFLDLVNKIKAFWDAIPDPFKELFSGVVHPNFALVTTGQQIIKQANENRFNPIPAGALANANQTQAITNNNNNNTRTLQTISDKRYNYGGITFNITSDNPKEAAREIQQAMYDIDNGRMT